MSISATTVSVERTPGRRRVLVAAGALAAVSVMLAVGFAHETLPSPLVLGAAVLAGLAVVALVLARYETAVGLGVVLLAVVRFQPAPTDVVLGLAIGVAILSRRFHIRRVPSLVLALLGAFVVLNVVSAVNSVSVGTALSFFGITAYLVVLSMWLAAYVDGHRRARQVLVCYLAAALLSAAIGVLAIVAPIPGRNELLFDGRAEALFKDPNVFGPFLIPALLMLLEETVTPRLLSVRRSVKLGGVVLLGLGLLFSYSRAAWLNVAVALAVMLVVLLLRRRSARAALGVLAVVIVAAVSGIAAIELTGSAHFLEQRAGLQSYDALRFSAQNQGIRLGEQNPIGIGPGQFDVIVPLAAHNVYIRVFAEQGPLGLLVMAVLVLATLGFAARNAVLGRDTYGIGSAALLGAWCGILANGVFIDTLHWRHLWLVAALIWAGAMRGTISARTRDGPARASVTPHPRAARRPGERSRGRAVDLPDRRLAPPFRRARPGGG